MDILNDVVLPLASSPWIYLITLLLVLVDGFFPPFPSETVVVALAALAASNGVPDLWPLLAVSAVGAFLGDNVAYGIGRACGKGRIERIKFRPLTRLLHWAEKGLAARPGTLVLSARYVPMGRIAVNVTAGAIGYSYWRFVPWCMLAGLLWASYNIAIGYLAGQWFEDNPLLGMVIAIVLAVGLGWLLDVCIGVIKARIKLRD